MPTYNPILRKLKAAVNEFMRMIPAAERGLSDRVQQKLAMLDLTPDGKIKATAKNISVINSVQAAINHVTQIPRYHFAIKNFAAQYAEINKLQKQYWKEQEAKFKPPRILKQLRQQAIDDVVSSLAGERYRANVTDAIRDVMRRNITTGGSYADLTKQLRDMIRNTRTPGILNRYVRQVTTDAINQYSAQYNQLVSADLGYTWFSYDGSDIVTTRPFCDAMTDQPYFHISEIPRLLRAEGLNYINKEGLSVPVPIYEKTGLPNGMIPGTNAANFIVNRGGYNCGHQIRPVHESQVPMDVKARVMGSTSYKAWASKRSGVQISLFNDKRMEKFTVGYAPFREGDISNISKADAAFDNKKFIEWRKMGTELADALGIDIIEDSNSVGVYAATSNNAEASRVITIEADADIAELYAAMMGTLAPDIQNSVMLNRYSDKGEQTEYYINFDSKSAAVSFVNNRRNYGIEDISLLYDDNTVLVLDFGGFNHDKLLIDYGEEIKNVEERKVETRFIGEDDYGKILFEARNTVSKHYGTEFGQALDDLLKLAEVGRSKLTIGGINPDYFNQYIKNDVLPDVEGDDIVYTRIENGEFDRSAQVFALSRPAGDVLDSWLGASSSVRYRNDDDPGKIFILKGASRPTSADVVYRGESYDFHSDYQTQIFNKLKDEIFAEGNIIDFSKPIQIEKFDSRDYRLASYSMNQRKAFTGFGNDNSSFYHSLLFEVRGKSGKVNGFDISSISIGGEEEVIIGNGFKYKVISNKPFGNRNVKIILEQQNTR